MAETCPEEVVSRGKQPSLRRIYLIALASTAVGMAAIIILNLATPLEHIPDRLAVPDQTGGTGRVRLSALLVNYAFLLVLGGLPLLLIIRSFLRPLSLYFSQRKTGRPDRDIRTKAGQRLINLPFVIIPVNLGLWILLPASLYLGAYLLEKLDLRTTVILSVRTTMIGFITAGIMSLWIEAFLRRSIIPRFFTQGRLTDIREAARFSISKRIRLVFRLGSLVPLAILVITLLTLQWQLETVSLSARDYGSGIIMFCLVLFGVFFVILSGLNKLINRSITGPVENMIVAVNQVKEGNYETRVRVVSNDELGLLGDAANEMIQGLRERETIKDAFGRYVTPQIRDEILAGRIPLNGERREATVLFSDLKGFTAYVESRPPEEVIASMREYFTAMHQAIRNHRGVVLQFAGDEMEAAFGIPLALEDHPDKAVQAALEMRRALDRLNRDRRSRGREVFSHGIGIHTGQVLAGNTGSQDQPAYALIGDPVNVASRIQGLTRNLGWDILVSRATVSRLQGVYALEALEPQVVKGHSKPVTIYRVLDRD